MFLSLIYKPHPLDQLDEHKIVLAVIKHFSEHYPEPFSIPEMAKDIGISLIHIEAAFDDYKGKSANQALLEYRLNRLCDHMTEDPSQEIHMQIDACGLASFAKTNIDFTEQFGIDLVEFHKQCFIAALARKQYERDTKAWAEDNLVGAQSTSDYKETRFHRKRI
jgi:transcriptional regulator GlxA family with amidase domain